MCTDKKFFRFENLADKEVAKGVREGFMPDTSHSYKCEYCVGWHTTSKPED